jgi:hypothetical protein
MVVVVAFSHASMLRLDGSPAAEAEACSSIFIGGCEFYMKQQKCVVIVLISFKYKGV